MTDTFTYTHGKSIGYSSFAAGAYYNRDNSELLIVTVDDQHLLYTDVPFGVYVDLSSAASPGYYYQSNIKGSYTYVPDVHFDFITSGPFDPDKEPVTQNQTLSVGPSKVTFGGVGLISPSEKDVDPTESADQKDTFTIYAEFDSFDDAYVAFSYLVGQAKSASLTKEVN